jgi:hypothetical protein
MKARQNDMQGKHLSGDTFDGGAKVEEDEEKARALLFFTIG